MQELDFPAVKSLEGYTPKSMIEPTYPYWHWIESLPSETGIESHVTDE